MWTPLLSGAGAGAVDLTAVAAIARNYMLAATGAQEQTGR